MTQANRYFDALTYTGNGAARSLTGLNFQPNLVWIKSRSAATDHKLTDSVRGATKGLISDTFGAETTDTNGLTSFDSTGFSLGTDTNYNNNAATYVAWCWKAGGAAVTNTDGSITSQVSANKTSGFSIVTYTGTGANGTVGHGLGAALNFLIVKDRTGARSWNVWHSAFPGTDYVFLESTVAQTSDATKWNSTIPTSSVFSLGTQTGPNNSGDSYTAYCWAAIPGYSAFGSYTGNGSTDGPFVFTGFLPRWVMIKRTDSTGDWFVYDTSRDLYNVVSNELYPNSSSAEYSTARLDFVSNGFKLRNIGAYQNASGGTYIYAAFATIPFKYSRAR